MYIHTLSTIKNIGVVFLLTFICFLITTSSAHAKVTIEGDRAFTDQVNGCLVEYRSAPGVVGEVITELQDSKYEHKIIDSPDWTNTPNNIEEATGGKGSGSVTRVNPEKLKEYVKRIESLKHKDFCTALLHELWHAVDNNRGTRTNHSDKVDGAKRNEIEATLFQNFVHAIRGVPPRTTYGGIDISKFVVIGYGDQEAEKKPEDTSKKPEKPTPPPPRTDMSFDHVKPGEYSEVYLVVTTTPGATVEVTLTGPGVDSPPQQSKTADGDGSVRFVWRIVSFGTYTAEGTSADTTFSSSVMVQ